ncbi:hypothetical protein MtrunA17_Chr4g0025991 [Medicago truncatula]|uniref:Transmembrane protein n=1 Tax=Medicago truncatula TaxID=3880 RepID=A0A396I887_MEDTR|nr:hypothetical protein MtrunA17_Chr4g0025991 [Medicago truncatula]
MLFLFYRILRVAVVCLWLYVTVIVTMRMVNLFRVVIFEQLFWYNFWDNLIVFSSYWSKTLENNRERKRERVRR